MLYKQEIPIHDDYRFLHLHDSALQSPLMHFFAKRFLETGDITHTWLKFYFIKEL